MYGFWGKLMCLSKGLFTQNSQNQSNFCCLTNFARPYVPILVSIWPTDITLHKIRWIDRKIPITKLDGEPGKIGRTAWQNQLDVTKIGSTTVCVSNKTLPYYTMSCITLRIHSVSTVPGGRSSLADLRGREFFSRCVTTALTPFSSSSPSPAAKASRIWDQCYKTFTVVIYKWAK